MRFAEHLESVADPHHRTTRTRMLGDRGHHRREARDRARAQVVAVREPARHDHSVDTVGRRVAVPQHFGRRTEFFDGPGDVEFAVCAGKLHNTDANRHEMVTSYASITGLASNRSHISLTCAWAASAS